MKNNLKNITEKNTIMTAEGSVLITIISQSLSALDDFMQISGDAGDEDVSNEISKEYNVIEKMYHKVKQNNVLSIAERNQFRLIMKQTIKQVGLYYC